MSTEYYASFSSVSITRQELAYEICEIISKLGASVDVDYDQLNFEEGCFVPTHEYIENNSLIKAIQVTEQWPGVQLHFTYEDRMCDIMLICDIPNRLTLIFSEPKSLYWQQIENETDLTLLEMLLLFMRIMSSSFCVFEPGWIRKSRTISDIEVWLSDLDEGRSRDWEMVIVAESEMPFELIPNRIKEENNFKRLEDLNFWYFSLE